MTHWKQLQNRDYLGSWDLKKDEERVLKITKVEKKMVFNQTSNSKEPCIVASFTQGKPMILNTTNCKTIEKLHKSPLIENWSGKEVCVYVDKVKAFGDYMDCLRVKSYVPTTEDIICKSCGKTVDSYGNMTPAQLAAYTKESYGKELCSSCAQTESQKTEEKTE